MSQRDAKKMRVGVPCERAWDELEGGGDRRHCGDCDRIVHNVSAMSREEAQTMLDDAAPGRVCVFGVARGDGTLMTAEEVPGRIADWLRRKARAAAPMAASFSVLIQPGGCETEKPPADSSHQELREITVEVTAEMPAPSPVEAEILYAEEFVGLLQIGGYIDAE